VAPSKPLQISGVSPDRNRSHRATRHSYKDPTPRSAALTPLHLACLRATPVSTARLATHACQSFYHHEPTPPQSTEGGPACIAIFTTACRDGPSSADTCIPLAAACSSSVSFHVVMCFATYVILLQHARQCKNLHLVNRCTKICIGIYQADVRTKQKKR